MLGAVNFAVAVIAIPFIERLGRKMMLIIGFFLMSFSDCLVGYF